MTTHKDFSALKGAVETDGPIKRKPAKPTTPADTDVVEERDEVLNDVNEVEENDAMTKDVVDADVDEDEDVDDDAETEAEADDDSDVVEEQVVEGVRILNIPYKNCHICRHLLPTLPATLPTKMGGDGKSPFGREFSCYTEDVCPARKINLVLNPFTFERVSEAVADYFENGSLEAVSELYDEAREINEAVYEQLHSMVKDMLAKQQ